MLIFNRQLDLAAHLSPAWSAGRTVGFVPTMGALHQGHLSLLKASLADNDVTVISIFVNPTQFNNPDDLAKYPRTLEADVEKINALHPDIIVFAPTVADIYGDAPKSIAFDFDGLENEMEGQFRPGHFDGVGTIVKRLFEIVKPNKAYFGEKDFQQLQIVRKMVQKTGLPVEIIGCPIFREPNGLAMSSRNERLTPQQREDAAVIYRTLLTAKTLLGTKNASAVADFVRSEIEKVPGFELEYFSVADEATLKPAEYVTDDQKYRAFIAVFVDKIRLIDTISLN